MQSSHRVTKSEVNKKRYDEYDVKSSKRSKSKRRSRDPSDAYWQDNYEDANWNDNR